MQGWNGLSWKSFRPESDGWTEDVVQILRSMWTKMVRFFIVVVNSDRRFATIKLEKSRLILSTLYLLVLFIYIMELWNLTTIFKNHLYFITFIPFHMYAKKQRQSNHYLGEKISSSDNWPIFSRSNLLFLEMWPWQCTSNWLIIEITFAYVRTSFSSSLNKQRKRVLSANL